MARGQAPAHVGVIGLGMAGPTIMAHGTEEQKTRYLQPILAAEEIWCQGFSEPDAGSDLAAARTRAERRGDVYVVNGQKVWSSFAHIADFCILVTQSDPDAARYGNLTYLLVDMHAPGVEVRPLRQITGEAEFNEIFFSDVEVPVENRLGDEGDGWQVAMTTLLHERATLGFALTATFDALFGRLLEETAEQVPTPYVRDALAREWIELQALRFTNYRALGTYQRTGVPGPEGSGVKLRWSEANQRLTKLARELRGPDETPRFRAAAAAEALGVAQRALDLGVEHAKTREQFGKPIGTYQAVSHPLAQTYTDVELARSLVYWAAWCVAEEDERAPAAAAAAKAFATEAAVVACERSIQVHGGIGFTWEHPLHRFYKRALWLEGFGRRPAELRLEVANALLA